MTVERYVAQINVARFRLPRDHEANAPFIDALDTVNAMADASDGFIWRLIGDGNDATDIEVVPGDPNVLINMSVWRDVAALEAFVYRQADHRAVLSRRADWFDHTESSFALWWVPAGHIPSVAEGIAMLERLKAEGPGPEVFTFRSYKAG